MIFGDEAHPRIATAVRDCTVPFESKHARTVLLMIPVLAVIFIAKAWLPPQFQFFCFFAAILISPLIIERLAVRRACSA